MFNGEAGGRSTCRNHCLEGQIEVAGDANLKLAQN